MRDTKHYFISLGLAVIIWLYFYSAQLLRKEQKMDNGELLHERSTSCMNSSMDVYLHFFWIFACIYGLSKFTELSERYLRAKIATKERITDMRVINEEWEKTLKLYEQDKKQVDEQMQTLREKNCGLEESLKDLRDCNLHLISENYMRTMQQDQQIQGLAQRVQDQQASNIYITNRHIHLTRQVFLNEARTEIDLKLHGEDLKTLNVWVQYLRMRKCYMGPIADPKLVLNGQPERFLPIVMTTEQMAKLQGIY